MYKMILFVTIVIFLMSSSCKLLEAEINQQEKQKTFHDISVEESLIPIHPGVPGKTPFWNQYAKRFIYAPAFDYDEIDNAARYHYDLLSLEDSIHYTFESDVPYAPLSPVWAKLPVGDFELNVFGISSNGDTLGASGKGQYYHAAPFNGPYLEPVMPYDSSAAIALAQRLNEDYIKYWFSEKAPDPEYEHYRYPTKIMGALIIGAATYARLKPNSDEAKRATELATIVADFLLGITDQEGPLKYFPPTYHGYDEIFDKKPNSHMQHENTMTPYAADAGNAYLDLYDLTNDEKYLNAAKRIAKTYLETQLDNGSWYLFVNNKTGEPIAENIAIPTSTINYFDRLRVDYNMEGLEKATAAAFKWIMENPVKTFNWQAQFEDAKASKPYINQSREQACDLAIYLFNNEKNIPLAEELVRFAEDQFVIWENPMDITIRSYGLEAYSSKNWLTPCVQEQYSYWMPVSRSAGIMIDTYWEAYKATKKEIYLAKAKSIANAFTVLQKTHDGDYPTYFTKFQLEIWLNNTIYPAKAMMRFGNNLEQLGK